MDLKKSAKEVMKKGILLLTGICLLAGCGRTGGESKTPEPVYSLDKAEEVFQMSSEKDGKGIDEEQLAAGVNRFAFSLYGQIRGEENIFFSPYSLCSALSMLDLSAGGETKTELEALLGITDLDSWSVEMRAYLEKEWTDDTFLITANSIWMEPSKEWSSRIEEDFLQPAGYYYQSELYETDFRNKGDEAANQVNEWVKEKTRGMIPRLADSFPPETVMVLMNAVYFEGKWNTPFEAFYTHKANFYGVAGTVKADMMNQYDSWFAYTEAYGIKGVTLRYQDSDVVMKIFLPMDPETENISDLFLALSDEEKLALISSLDTAEGEWLERLALPKFTVEQEIEGLNEILRNMGLQNAFLEEQADFDILAEDVFLSEVRHRAKIIVDEEGSRAAAATEIDMTDGAAPIAEEPPKVFIADHPFLYVIQDEQTGMILFFGQVNSFK